MFSHGKAMLSAWRHSYSICHILPKALTAQQEGKNSLAAHSPGEDLLPAWIASAPLHHSCHLDRPQSPYASLYSAPSRAPKPSAPKACTTPHRLIMAHLTSNVLVLKESPTLPHSQYNTETVNKIMLLLCCQIFSENSPKGGNIYIFTYINIYIFPHIFIYLYIKIYISINI